MKETKSSVLQHCEALSQMVMDSSTDAIIVSDSKEKLVNWNKQATKLFGWMSDEAVNNLALNDVFTEESCEAIESTASENADSYEVMAVRKNNIQFPAEIRSYNMTLNQKNVRMLFIRDITIQRLIEERYRLAKNGR